MREVTNSWAANMPYGKGSEAYEFMEEIYDRLLPNEYVLDDDWAQMRIETAKALIKGQDDVLI